MPDNENKIDTDIDLVQGNGDLPKCSSGQDNLESEYNDSNCNVKIYSKKCNKFLLKKEFVESECLEDDNITFLYPNLNDKNFNLKIADKKEFNDNKYDGTIHTNVKEYADSLAKAEFELSPHQVFVKNFLSFQTPYNSLLLYHGLGSGKTCSAIGVCEEMRDYLKQVGLTRRIIIVASENVQDNFRLQLFDDRKLKLIDGLWNIQACIGNKLIKEINPMNMKGIPRDKVVSQIKTLINNSYVFLGYGQFANYIINTINYNQDVKKNETKNKSKTKNESFTLNKQAINRLRNEFDNRLIVIDEVHNIRITDENDNKKVAINLEILVKAVENMRLLLLSATPIYNSYKEIIWLLNLMNINDRRAILETKDIFDKDGNFKSGGEELLIRKATGYVSFVRGENPYTFPYRVYPKQFATEHTFPFMKYPIYQMNRKKIKKEYDNPILSLYLTTIGGCDDCGECQACSYRYIIHNLRNKNFNISTKKGVVREMPNFENMESFGYTLLQIPLESLIISYPSESLKNIIKKIPKEVYSEVLEKKPSPINDTNLDIEEITEDSSINGGATDNIEYIDPRELTGRKGLERMMTFVDTKTPPEKGEYEYKQSIIEKYGKIFSRNVISKYSSKIKNILDNIYNPETGMLSDGIILIYSQYIDSGLIPVALALEEMGFTRYGEKSKPLFKNKPTDVIDVRTMKPNTVDKKFMPARYSMITGDPRLSPDNEYEIKGLTNEDNKDGHRVKVILISKAGSEGIDLKFIRQVHILEPWYNMNRIEQIIGRAVRSLSHKDLKFEKRNVQIFMYGTILEENKEEAADLYVYRIAEFKAVQIGKVSRVLKESAVDCIINHEQTNFNQEQMKNIVDITQQLSTGLTINNFKIGDEAFSSACDYMSECYYSCRPNKKINVNEDTYNESFSSNNSEKIIQRIRMIMREGFFYKKSVLIDLIRIQKDYPIIQIYYALSQLIDDNSEYILDKYGRTGNLVNIGEYYLFQPSELSDKNISIFDRSVPIDYKHNMIKMEIKPNILEIKEDDNIKEDIIDVYGKRIINDLKVNYDLVIEYSRIGKVERGDDNWYKHYGVVVKKMSLDYYDIKIIKDISEEKPEYKIKDFLLGFTVDHILDNLLFDEKIVVLNYLYSLKTISNNTFESLAKEYFERNIIIVKKLQAILLYKLNKKQIMILNDGKWIEAEPEDEREINEENGFSLILEKDFNNIIGFVGYEKGNKYLIFKTKDLFSKRNTGARCDESGKIKTLELLNKIVEQENRFTKENTKVIKVRGSNIGKEAVGQIELCVLQEIILRYFNKIKRNNLIWFLTPETALYNNF